MQNKKIIVLIVLGITAVISLIYGIVASPKAGRKVISKPEAIQEELPQLTKRIVPTKRRVKRTAHASWGRNPFAPKLVPVTEPSIFILDGIMWHEENPKAMINNTIVAVGDKVNGNTVVDIKKDRVILNDGTKDSVLKLEF